MDYFHGESEPQTKEPPRPYKPPNRPPHFGDLTVSTINESDISHKKNLNKKVPTSVNSKDNLRHPVSHSKNDLLAHKPPASTVRKHIGTVSSSPAGRGTGASLNQSKGTPTVRRSGSVAGHLGHRAQRTPGNLIRSGSTISTNSRPIGSLSKLQSSKKAMATPNATLNESVMSFIPSGEVDAEGNPLSKSEEERIRMSIEVAYCRTLQLQILRAKLRRSAESQGRDVLSQLSALWEETQRLRESSFQKRAEAADIRRQRELHLATKLGGAAIFPEDENFKELSSKNVVNSGTPSMFSGNDRSVQRRVKQKLHSSSSKRSTETKDNPTDLRSVCELLAPTMKDLTLLAESIDKTRHALPMKDVVNASTKQLTSAMHACEGALVDMPKMAKLATNQPSPVDGDCTEIGERMRIFREFSENLGIECQQTAICLQQGGEMACHVLALNECSRLKSKSNDWTKC